MTNCSRSNTRKIEDNKREKLFNPYSSFFIILGLIGLGISLMITLTWISIQDAAPRDYMDEDLHSAPNANGPTLSSFTMPTEETKKNEWNLALVNQDNPIPADHKPQLTTIEGSYEVDFRIADSLRRMLDDCMSKGLLPTICSAYRTYELQEQLYNQNVNTLLYQGYSDKEARREAARSVAIPGTSEHQLGLAVDIVDYYSQNLTSEQENTQVQKWLMENSWKYGFILRYPSDKSDITGIIYEPWHYRYIGEAAAKEIYEQGICLEEYLGAEGK